MPGVGERTASGDRVVDRVHTGREIHLGEVRLAGLLRGTGGPLRSPAAAEALAALAAARGAEAAGHLVEGGEHFGGLQVEEGQGPHGGAQFSHGDGGSQAAAHDVADDEGGAVAGQLDHVEPVAADLGGGVARQIAAGDVETGRLRVAGGQEAALEDQGAFVLAAVEAGVVDADGGAGGQFGGQTPVALPERLAALRTGELDEADDGVVRDHRHGERRLHEAHLVAGDVLDPAGAQRHGTGRAEREAVDGAERGRQVVRARGPAARHRGGRASETALAWATRRSSAEPPADSRWAGPQLPGAASSPVSSPW